MSIGGYKVRYFFDIEDGVDEVRDDEGLELSGLEAAKAEAVRTLPDLAKSGVPERDQRVVAIRVRDETGQAVLKASLTLAVEQVRGS
jgi:hypothetical protein